jgi:antitoxin CcdA
MEIYGKTLKQLRTSLGKNQTEFSAMIGTHQGRYSKWERGKEAPSGRYAMRILDIAASADSAFVAVTGDPSGPMSELPISSERLEEAKALGIDVSRAAEVGIAEAVAAEKTRRWKDENREAIESSNAYVEEHGLPLAKYRMF